MSQSPTPQWVYFLRSMRDFIAICAVTTSVVAADHTVTAVGSFSCYDGSRDITFPLAGARIEMWNSNCDGSTLCDDKMGESHIADDGTFSVTGRGGDLFSGPDVYLRVVYNDDAGVRLTDELNRDRWVDTPEHDHDNRADETIDFGAWLIGNDVGKGNASQCGVWHFAREAYRQYISITSKTPPAGHYDIEYWSAIWAGTPWTNTDTTHWPIHYSTAAQPHEFAHTVRHAADGDASHFTGDATRFRYARNHSICDANSNRIGTDTHAMDLAFGFNEGWAEFWEGSTNGCWAATIDPASEGNNAYALNVLSSQPSVGKAKMVDVLLAHPGEIHSLDDFMAFLAPAVGVSSSALVETVRNTARPSEVATRPYGNTFEKQVKDVRAQIAIATRLLADRRSALIRAEQAARRIRTCVKVACEAAFWKVASVPILRAEGVVNALAIERLKQSITPAFQRQLSQEFERGQYDRFVAASRLADQRKAASLLMDGLKQAIVNTGPLVERSSDAAAMAIHLKRRLVALQREVDTRNPLPSGVAPNLALPEDRAVKVGAR